MPLHLPAVVAGWRAVARRKPAVWVATRLRALVRDLRRDCRGSVLVVTAAGALAVMALASIGIDLGGIALARRRAQGAVDLAVLVAASNLAQAEPLARRSLADNGYGHEGSVTVSLGLYRADAAVDAATRFTAGLPSGNAVRVSMQTGVRTHLGQFVGLPRTIPVAVTGTAAQAQFAALTIGSGAASLDAGIGNAVLGAMLGTRLSLTTLDYTALLSTRVDALRFLDALAAGLGRPVGRYAEILQARASMAQIVGALRVAAQGEANAAPALAALGTVLSGLAGSASSAATVPVAQIADLGAAIHLSMEPSSKGPPLGLLDLIANAANLGNGQRPVSVDLGASVPGLLSARLTLAMGERRQNSGWARPGGLEASVHTAQVRLLLEVALAAPLGLGSLNLPLYVEVAPGRATLRALTCPWSNRSERRVGVDAQPGLLTLAVADMPRSSVVLGGPGPDLTRAAILLSLPAVSVTAQGRTDLAASAAQSITFTDGDIARGATRRVASTGLARSLTSSLLWSLKLSIAGADPGLMVLLKPLLGPTLTAVAPSIDGSLDGVLRTVGVQVGYVDVTIPDTVCDGAVLVQ